MGLYLNCHPGHVLAKKGSKSVAIITSTGIGETITVIGCCNVMSRACIFKGKIRKLNSPTE